VPAENNAYGILLKAELETLRRQPDYYILHEHLEDINEPLYFHQFIERAARHGLQYLAEADFSTMLASSFPAEVAETLARIGPDVVRQEQFMDFLRNRTFRQTLLVRSEMSPDRKVTPDRVKCLGVSGSLAPKRPSPDIRSSAAEQFQAANGGLLTTPHPVTKAAAVVLADRWPKALAFPELLSQARLMLGEESRDAMAASENMEEVLASDVLQCYAAGLMHLHAMPSPFATEPGERPCASPLARYQIRHGTTVTNLRHERVAIDQDLGRVLRLLDGSRRQAEIERIMTDWAAVAAAGQGRVRQDAARRVGDQLAVALQHFSKLALLI
jgi:methyltransferase-like protein